MWWGERIAWRALWEEGEASIDGSSSGPAAGWMDEVRKAARQAAANALEYERTNPTWDYFHAPRSGLTVLRCERLARLLRAAADGDRDERWDGPEGTFTQNGALQNCVPSAVVERGTKILRRLEPQLQLVPPTPAADLPRGPGRSGRAEVRRLGEGGLRAEGLRTSSGERPRPTQERAAFLFSSAKFRWADAVPPHRFEALVRELLAASKDVLRVRSAGPTNDRDRGRDLIAELAAPGPREGGSPRTVAGLGREVVVQCKARAGTVGKLQVRDVRDTVERHEAAGTPLAVSTEISGDLVDYLSELRSRLEFVDWWDPGGDRG